MATDATARSASRPRPWLVILLGVVVLAYLAMTMFSGGTAGPTVTNRPSPRPTATTGGKAAVDPAELDVKIEALAQSADSEVDPERNPFRFQPKPPPPPPPSSVGTVPAAPVNPGPTGPPVDPGPPPIGNSIKFIGIVVQPDGERIGAFSDCKVTFPGREGEVVEGRYRVVRIGVESAVLEYADGKGRTTLPLNGQACVGK